MALVLKIFILPCYSEDTRTVFKSPETTGIQYDDKVIKKKGITPGILSCLVPGLGQWYAQGFQGLPPRKSIGHFCIGLYCWSSPLWAYVMYAVIALSFPTTVGPFMRNCLHCLASSPSGRILVLPLSFILLINAWSAYDAYTNREESWLWGYL